MGWKLYFWAIALMLVAPLPFKLYEYATGRDTSPRIVKIEEMANAVFFLGGLVGLYAYAFAAHALATPWWRAWVVAAVLLSIGGVLWSPKVRHAHGVMGAGRTRAVMAVGTLVLLPMLVGVWRAGALA
jgi:hypothetical protein